MILEGSKLISKLQRKTRVIVIKRESKRSYIHGTRVARECTVVERQSFHPISIWDIRSSEITSKNAFLVRAASGTS